MNTEQTILAKLQTEFEPAHLQVINESHMHSVPANSETHFKLIIVSEKFAEQSLINRHRAVNAVLAEELAGGVHALGLHTMTVSEWEKKQGEVAASPQCLGGSKKS